MRLRQYFVYYSDGPWLKVRRFWTKRAADRFRAKVRAI